MFNSIKKRVLCGKFAACSALTEWYLRRARKLAEHLQEHLQERDELLRKATKLVAKERELANQLQDLERT